MTASCIKTPTSLTYQKGNPTGPQGTKKVCLERQNGSRNPPQTQYPQITLNEQKKFSKSRTGDPEYAKGEKSSVNCPKGNIVRPGWRRLEKVSSEVLTSMSSSIPGFRDSTNCTYVIKLRNRLLISNGVATDNRSYPDKVSLLLTTWKRFNHQ
ncbi:hypothetical protein L873DRAFT_1794275 [Choiromyces venosus 120613-1]|uniref:Uncharacterized protein n=1 Tax=Choiromyces venosus 120613-1 TaxID=1336337 RepID=A0A3N4J5J8_9PEZI|nr:hypothetical protein L873DRAFT_1794275 [Choiromyces venosus 120613-1]